MPYGLDGLWNNKASVTFAVDGNKAVRDKTVAVETIASFVVRWAKEIYSEWATWIKYLLPGSKPSYWSDTVQISYLIKKMVRSGQIVSYNEGWQKITDLLRAEVIYKTSNQVVAALEKL